MIQQIASIAAKIKDCLNVKRSYVTIDDSIALIRDLSPDSVTIKQRYYGRIMGSSPSTDLGNVDAQGTIKVLDDLAGDKTNFKFSEGIHQVTYRGAQERHQIVIEVANASGNLLYDTHLDFYVPRRDKKAA